MTSLLDRFFAVEGNSHVVRVLREAIDGESAPAMATFTFNVFNVRIDREKASVWIQDDLDPSQELEVDIEELRALLRDTDTGRG